MCLHKSTNMQVADEDITCYKIIEIHHLRDGSIRHQSYYQEVEITFGIPMEAADKLPIEKLNEFSILNEEVVHAYIELPDVSENRLNTLKQTTSLYLDPLHVAADIAVIECTIPKGTYYCIGKDSFGASNYGALTIIPNTVIKILATVRREQNIIS